MKQILRAKSPAKLILSGEHAVIYGQPAIAMAVNCYAESTITANLSSAILFNLLNLDYAKSLTIQALYALKDRLQNKYHAFLSGQCSIRDVLKRPFELLQYTVSNLLEKWNIPLSQGLEISATSEIPIGCGMGSSAALVMSTLYAVSHFFNLEIDRHRYLSLGREAENLQHGFSSGLDLQLAMMGGCVRFQNGKVMQREMPKFPFNIVQTGVPESSTGQCVSFTAPFFKNGSLAEDFGAITTALDEALNTHNLPEIQNCIKKNHELLVKIGVVPLKIQEFVRAIEQSGGAAKICGAGSVSGDNAGVVLVVSDQDLSSIIQDFKFSIQNVMGDTRGTHLV